MGIKPRTEPPRPSAATSRSVMGGGCFWADPRRVPILTESRLRATADRNSYLQLACKASRGAVTQRDLYSKSLLQFDSRQTRKSIRSTHTPHNFEIQG